MIKKLLWFAGMMIALTALGNAACGPKEKFCVDMPDFGYHCMPPQEESGGFGGRRWARTTPATAPEPGHQDGAVCNVLKTF